MQPSNIKILRRIDHHGRGFAFTPKDFLDLASRGAIDMSLSALAADGVIRRIARGLYDYPRSSPALGGQLSPDTDQVAQAIARRFRWRIIPEGPLAANLLGLSTQVPARIVYLSDGPTRKIQIGKQVLYFKHAQPKETRTEGTVASLVIQALRYLGKDAVDDGMVQRLREKLSPTERRRLLREARYSAGWIYETARRIAREEP